jgi:hypothetical protein
VAQMIPELCTQVKYNFPIIFNSWQYLCHCWLYSHFSFCADSKEMIVWIKHKTYKTMWQCFIPGNTVYIHTCQVQQYIYSLWYSLNILGMISMMQKLSTHIECISKAISGFNT